MQYPFGNFYEIIETQANKRGKKIALFFGKEKISYNELLRRVDIFAGYLYTQEVRANDRVALFLQNSIEFIVALFAISKVGGVSVPINTFLKSEELAYILSDCGAKILIASTVYQKVIEGASASQELAPLIIWEGEELSIDGISFAQILTKKICMEALPRGLNDRAVIVYTSGTTGRPKGAILSYRNIFSNCEVSIERLSATSKDRSIIFLPMFHSFTLTVGIILFMYSGASIVIIKSLKPFSNIFKQILLRRVTLFIGVPDVYNAIAKAKLPWYFIYFNKIRAFISGAAALQGHTLDAMAQKFKRAKLLEGYGLSEASPVVCVNPPRKPKPKSVGTAMKGYEICIVGEDMVELPRGEVGDIITKGENIMQGYLGHAAATEETIINGWLLTGDMGYMDDEGYLFIVDRKKDLIISKGINIYPREIEEYIDMFDGVSASAVVGIADEKNGEIPIAYIELEDEVGAIDIASLRNYLKEHLANFKIPKSFHIIEELPKNATGKVLKRQLRENLHQN